MSNESAGVVGNSLSGQGATSWRLLIMKRHDLASIFPSLSLLPFNIAAIQVMPSPSTCTFFKLLFSYLNSMSAGSHCACNWRVKVNIATLSRQKPVGNGSWLM
jgi:hypothetical protein